MTPFLAAPTRKAIFVALVALMGTCAAPTATTRLDVLSANTAGRTAASTLTVLSAPAGTAVSRAPLLARQAITAARSSRRSSPAGRIVIPRIGLDVATFEGIDIAMIDQGPSHWEVTAEPGEIGNTTFAGHRTTHTHPFLNIDLIQAGDEVIFVNANGIFTYQATDAFVVDRYASWIAEPTDTPTFTLFACHPKHSEAERYVVKGSLVRAQRADASLTTEQPSAPATTTTTTPATRCVLCVG